MKLQALYSVLLLATARAQSFPMPEVVAVAMRDGIHLSTDVYGAETGARKPALLLRTPYNKRGG